MNARDCCVKAVVTKDAIGLLTNVCIYNTENISLIQKIDSELDFITEFNIINDQLKYYLINNVLTTNMTFHKNNEILNTTGIVVNRQTSVMLLDKLITILMKVNVEMKLNINYPDIDVVSGTVGGDSCDNKIMFIWSMSSTINMILSNKINKKENGLF
jgi:hypothetical protein